MHPTRRTVLSYLAALGSAASSRSAGALISQDSNSTAKDSAAERDRQIANEHLQRLEGPEFYVAESGNDGNPGTKERPLASLARAQELVRLIDGSGKVLITCRSHSYLSQMTRGQRNVRCAMPHILAKKLH